MRRRCLAAAGGLDEVSHELAGGQPIDAPLMLPSIDTVQVDGRAVCTTAVAHGLLGQIGPVTRLERRRLTLAPVAPGPSVRGLLGADHVHAETRRSAAPWEVRVVGAEHEKDRYRAPRLAPAIPQGWT